MEATNKYAVPWIETGEAYNKHVINPKAVWQARRKSVNVV